MMPIIKTEVTGTNPEDLQLLIQTAQDARKVESTAADGIISLVVQHLTEYDAAHPNKLGGERTHWFRKAGEHVEKEQQGDNVEVVVNWPGFQFQYEGGTITPGKGISSKTGKPTQFLTIPAMAEAYGHRAADFDLDVAFGRGGRPVGLKDEDNRIMFWLVKSATIGPHPETLPREDAIVEYAVANVQEMLSNIADGKPDSNT